VEGARKVLDDIQAAPIDKPDVDEKWIVVPASVGEVRVRIVKPVGAAGIDDATLDRAAEAFTNPDYVDVVIPPPGPRCGAQPASGSADGLRRRGPRGDAPTSRMEQR
jgi:hypothetical protein